MVLTSCYSYTMGVTDIEFLPWEHTLAVGRYVLSMQCPCAYIYIYHMLLINRVQLR